MESGIYIFVNFTTCTYIFRTAFQGSGLFADPDPDSGKKVRSGLKGPDPKHCKKHSHTN